MFKASLPAAILACMFFVIDDSSSSGREKCYVLLYCRYTLFCIGLRGGLPSIMCLVEC